MNHDTPTPRTDALREWIHDAIKEAFYAGFNAESIEDMGFIDEFAETDEQIEGVCAKLERELAEAQFALAAERLKHANSEAAILSRKLAAVWEVADGLFDLATNPDVSGKYFQETVSAYIELKGKQ